MYFAPIPEISLDHEGLVKNLKTNKYVNSFHPIEVTSSTCIGDVMVSVLVSTVGD